MEINIVTREYATCKFVRCKGLFDDLMYRCSMSENEFSDTFRKFTELAQQLVQMVESITRLSKDDAITLVTEKLLQSEIERQKFFDDYHIMNEYEIENTCKQMFADA